MKYLSPGMLKNKSPIPDFYHEKQKKETHTYYGYKTILFMYSNGKETSQGSFKGTNLWTIQIQINYLRQYAHYNIRVVCCTFKE
jgi:hypothetical protein